MIATIPVMRFAIITVSLMLCRWFLKNTMSHNSTSMLTPNNWPVRRFAPVKTSSGP